MVLLELFRELFKIAFGFFSDWLTTVIMCFFGLPTPQ